MKKRSSNVVKRIWTVGWMLLSISAIALQAGNVQQGSQVDILLGAALHQEEVEGEIQQAITTYEQVLAAEDVSRLQAARAQYRIGVCYEKLGRREAQKAFETVIRDFADQAEFADLARARLADLTTEEQRTTTIKKLPTSGDSWGSVIPWNISSDGRLAGATAYDTGNIAVLDLVTGESREVSDYGNWNNEKGFVDQVAISRDGKWLAAWHYKDGATSGNLRIIQADGEGERVLYRDPGAEDTKEWGIPTDWSPDGKWIALQIWRGIQGAINRGKAEIALISVETGEKRVVRAYEFGWRHSPKIRFSPDGKYLAYDLPVSPESTDTDLRLFSLDTGEEASVAAHSGRDQMIDWTPEGNLLFLTERTGGRDLFRVAITDGHQAGDPERVRQAFSGEPILGMDRQGSLYYAETNWNHHSFRARIDPETGRNSEEPAPIAGALKEGIRSPSWSLDGRSLAFLKTRPSPGVTTIVIRDGTEKEREIVPRIDAHPRMQLRWHEDGESLLAWGQGEEDAGLFQIDLISGETQLLVTGMRVGVIGDWSSDGRYLYFRRHRRQSGVIQYDRLSGDEQVLHTVSEGIVRAIRLSPSGKQVVFNLRTDDPEQRNSQLMQLSLLSVDSGEIAPLGEAADGLFYPFFSGQVCWTQDEKRIYFVVQTPDGSGSPVDSPSEIAFMDLDGGTLRKTGITQSERISEIAVRPDGRELAWTVSTLVRTPWVMANFLDED